jgi:hypothetical protein
MDDRRMFWNQHPQLGQRCGAHKPESTRAVQLRSKGVASAVAVQFAEIKKSKRFAQPSLCRFIAAVKPTVEIQEHVTVTPGRTHTCTGNTHAG